jgi:hypothetical protein
MRESPIIVDQDGIDPWFRTIKPQQLTDNNNSFTF